MPGVTKDRRGYEPHHEQARLASPAAISLSAEWRLGIAIERVIAPTKLRTTCRLLLLAALLLALPLVVEATPLHDAARANDVAKIEQLIAAGTDVNARGETAGRTPLHTAARKGALSVVALLIEHGADVNAKDSNGFTPLLLAIRKNAQARKIAALLIEHGTDVNAKNVHGATPLYEAIGDGMVEILAALIEHGADVNEPAGRIELKPLLFWVISKARNADYPGEEIAAMLIAAGVDVNARTQFEGTPLHRAASSKNAYDVMTLLIAAGADVNAKSRSHLVSTPLSNAIDAGAIKNVALLIEHGADVNMPVGMLHETESPIFATIEDPDEEIAAMLIAAGADVSAKRESDGSTPLHLAAFFNAHRMMAVLINARADVNARDNEGRTPLTIAQTGRSREAIALLQKHGAH